MAAFFVSLPLFAAAPARPYHLVLDARPAAAFPYLSKFGSVELHVYPAGVRAEALWLNAFSRNGAPNVTVVNPLGRMYADVPVSHIASTLSKLAGSASSVERNAVPAAAAAVNGTMNGLPATRHRLMYGPNAWIDVWTTALIPENPQLDRIVDQLLRGISPGTAAAARQIRGTPIAVDLNFRRFKNVHLLSMKKLNWSIDDETDALTLGSFYMRAPLLEKLFE